MLTNVKQGELRRLVLRSMRHSPASSNSVSPLPPPRLRGCAAPGAPAPAAGPSGAAAPPPPPVPPSSQAAWCRAMVRRSSSRANWTCLGVTPRLPSTSHVPASVFSI